MCQVQYEVAYPLDQRTEGPAVASQSTSASGLLAGRTAVVTGSGQNVGRAIALHFAREGASVIVNGHRNRANVEAVVAEIQAAGGKAAGVMADVGDPAAVADMVAKAK